MGPFVPDIFSNELNYIIALVIGVAFGFSLEQAGFSSSRKLAGMFYGYDMTVLKVFFTAALTAIAGVLLLNYFGYLNLNVIYVNPTFLPSALAGGIIMGLGFIIGGFCPGTSVCAAAIGKIDAMFYIVGIMIGIFLFTVFYPGIEAFYKADYLGSIKIYDTLGMSRGAFVFLLILVAIGAFITATLVEKKINRVKDHPEKPMFKKYYLSIAFSIVVAFILLFLPEWKTKLLAHASGDVQKDKQAIEMITDDELAYRLINMDEKIQLVDVREPDEYKRSKIVSAVNIPVDSMVNAEWYSFIKNNRKTLVFYSDKESKAEKAYFVARELGHENNKVLKGGITVFNNDFFNRDYRQGARDDETARFRTEAAASLKELEKTLKNKKLPKKKPKTKIVGGC